MKQQRGFAHLYLILGLVLAIIVLLGFVIWQNYFNKDDSSTNNDSVLVTDDAQKTETPKSTTPEVKELKVTLNSRDVTVDVGDSKYKDLTATFDNEAGWYYVYSADLTARLNSSNGRAATALDCNAAIVVDTYAKDDVAGSYYNAGEANGKYVHVGFMGPCDPAPNDASLAQEAFALREYLQAKFKASLQ